MSETQPAEVDRLRAENEKLRQRINIEYAARSECMEHEVQRAAERDQARAALAVAVAEAQRAREAVERVESEVQRARSNGPVWVSNFANEWLEAVAAALDSGGVS